MTLRNKLEPIIRCTGVTEDKIGGDEQANGKQGESIRGIAEDKPGFSTVFKAAAGGRERIAGTVVKGAHDTQHACADREGKTLGL